MTVAEATAAAAVATVTLSIIAPTINTLLPLTNDFPAGGNCETTTPPPLEPCFKINAGRGKVNSSIVPANCVAALATRGALGSVFTTEEMLSKYSLPVLSSSAERSSVESSSCEANIKG